jgi:hypothetical protein
MFSLALAAMALGGQDAVPAGAQSVEPVFECRTIAADAARLACYDAAVNALVGQQADQFVVVDLARVEAVERDSFGLTLPTLPDLPSLISRENDLSVAGVPAAGAAPVSDPQASAEPARPAATPGARDQAPSRVVERDDEGQIDRIELEIAEVSLSGYEAVIFEMTNGQVWRVAQGSARLVRQTDAGDLAEIRRAAAGSYLLRVNGDGRAYRARRVR